MDPLHSLDSAGGFGPPGQGFESLRALSNNNQVYYTYFQRLCMNPGIGLMDKRLKTEKSAISLAISGVLKNYNTIAEKIEVLETKYDEDAGDWYVCLLYTSPSPRDQRGSIQMMLTLDNSLKQRDGLLSKLIILTFKVSTLILIILVRFLATISFKN